MTRSGWPSPSRSPAADRDRADRRRVVAPSARACRRRWFSSTETAFRSASAVARRARAVAIQVRERDRHRRSGGRVVHLRRERSVTVVEQHADRCCAPPGDDEVGTAVPVQVTGRERGRPAVDRVLGLAGSRGPVSSAERDPDRPSWRSRARDRACRRRSDRRRRASRRRGSRRSRRGTLGATPAANESLGGAATDASPAADRHAQRERTGRTGTRASAACYQRAVPAASPASVRACPPPGSGGCSSAAAAATST